MYVTCFVCVLLCVKDTMDLLFNSKSAPNRGTIAQLKNAFRHVNLKSNVTKNYQHVADMREVSSFDFGYAVIKQDNHNTKMVIFYVNSSNTIAINHYTLSPFIIVSVLFSFQQKDTFYCVGFNYAR